MSLRLFRTIVPARRLAGLGLLVLALLWAQLLGLAHGVRHAAPAAAGAWHALAHATPGAQDLLTHLAAPAAETPDCRLYDQLGQAAPLLQLPPWPAAVVPAWLAPAVRAVPVLAVCAAYAARAPPATR